MKIKLGIYKHFKGTEVEVIGVALNSETQEEMVIYNHPDQIKGKKANTLWAHPIKMFNEEVNKPELNYKGPRFVFVNKT